MKAQKAFYDRIKSEMSEKRSRKLEFWQSMTLFYTPVFALVFVTVYWIAGLRHANII